MFVLNFSAHIKGHDMTRTSRFILNLVASLLLAFSFLSMAFALPTPKDIESAVNGGNYAQAESLLREVLREKPQSAKAHYELGQVLAHLQRYKEAQVELDKAKEIDPSLKFAASPEKFNAISQKVNSLASPSGSVVMEPSAAVKSLNVDQPDKTTASSESGISLSYVWIAIAALVALGLWLRRSATASVNANTNMASSSAGYSPAPAAPVPNRGFGAQFTPGAQAPMNTGINTGANTGSTMTGAIVGGLAGVAAGYALSKALEGDHHDAAPSASPQSGSVPSGNGGYVTFDTPAQPDLGAFDSGSGSDWDNAGNDSSDDSW